MIWAKKRATWRSDDRDDARLRVMGIRSADGRLWSAGVEHARVKAERYHDMNLNMQVLYLHTSSAKMQARQGYVHVGVYRAMHGCIYTYMLQMC